MRYDEPIPAAAVGDPADGLPPEIWEEPLAEDELHLLVLTYVFEALGKLLRGRADLTIAADGAVQWDPTDLRRHVAPDVYLAFGVPREKRRRSYATWVEGKGIDLVFEITSESTWKTDLGSKRDVYQDVLGVSEYVVFDPQGRWIRPQLQLQRREGGLLVPVELEPGEPVALKSVAADLVVSGERLVLIDRETGEPVLDAMQELEARERAENAQRRAERAQRRAEQARRRAEQAKLRAEQAQRDAEERADGLERELRRLRGEADG